MREWVEKAGKPYDIDNRTAAPSRSLPATRFRRAWCGPERGELELAASAWSTLKI